MEPQRPPWSSQTKLTVTLLVLGFLIYLLYRFNVVIKPFILAVILAFVLSPLANRFQAKMKIHRGVATLLSYLVLLMAAVVVLALLFPPLVEQATTLNLNFPRYISELESFLGKDYSLAGWRINLETVVRQLDSLVRGVVQPIFSQTITLIIEMLSSFIWIIFIAVVTFYLVKDGPALSQWLENLVPPAYQGDYILIRHEMHQIWSAFFRGQLVLALVVMAIFTIAGLLIGLPFVLPLAIFAGFLEFLPSIGHGIWLVTASILAFFVGSTWMPIPNWAFTLLVIGLHLFYQQFDLNYLIPRVIGKRMRLPPLVVILGIVAGAVLAGVIGILIAAPTIASARVLGRYVYANLTDNDPFPDTVASALPPPNPRWWRKTQAAASHQNSPEP